MAKKQQSTTSAAQQFSVAHRVDIIGTILANNCLPNGDPNMMNAPRVDFNGFGIISDVCQKFKIRRRVATLAGDKDGYCMFIAPNNVDERCLDEKVSEFTFDGNIDVEGLRETYFDIRAFGAVLISSNDESTAEGAEKPAKKTKAKKTTDHVNGCVSVMFAKSTEPINAQDISIIRCAIQKESERQEKKKNTMGGKQIVNHAVYRMCISVNARRAAQNGFSDEDLAILIDAIRTMFVDDESAARPAGSLDVGNLFVVTHGSIDGDESSAKTFARLAIKGDSAIMCNTDVPDGMTITKII